MQPYNVPTNRKTTSVAKMTEEFGCDSRHLEEHIGFNLKELETNPLTADQAQKLGDYFHTSAQFWMTIDRNHRRSG